VEGGSANTRADSRATIRDSSSYSGSRFMALQSSGYLRVSRDSIFSCGFFVSTSVLGLLYPPLNPFLVNFRAGDHDLWPEMYVEEVGEGEGNQLPRSRAPRKRTGLVRSMNAVGRTATITWLEHLDNGLLEDPADASVTEQVTRAAVCLL
jgi:hypothetical protein